MQFKGNFGNNAPMQGFFAVMKTDCFAVQGELMMDELMKQIEDYSGLTFKPVRHCLAVLSVLSAASSPCPDLKLIHYMDSYNQERCSSKLKSRVPSHIEPGLL